MNERDITRERFVSAIADKLNPEDVAEVHLFHPMKAGGLESGVAVLAVRERKAPAATEAASPSEPDVTGASHVQAEEAEDIDENEPADASPFMSAAENNPISPDERLAVYTAKYRLTLKGPERGKWAFDITAEADAPLITLDRVVQGVQRRSGDSEEPRKLNGEEFRALLPPKDAARGQGV